MSGKIIRPSVVLIKDGKILLLKSKYASGEFYLLPGGRIEGFESVQETAIREVKEETNYDVEIQKMLYVCEWIDEPKKKNVMDMVFLAKIKSGTETHLNDPCLEKGHIQAIEWFNVDDLIKIKFYPEPIIPFLIKDFKKGFTSSAIYIN